MRIWLNGKFQDADSARVGASSAGLMLGWGVFTTIGVWHRRPFALDRHLARLRRDARRAHLDLNIDDITLQNALLHLIETHFAQVGATGEQAQSEQAQSEQAQSEQAQSEQAQSEQAQSEQAQSDGIARITVTRRGDGNWNQEPGSDVCVLFRPCDSRDLAQKATASRRGLREATNGEETDQPARNVEAGTRPMSTHGADLFDGSGTVRPELRLAMATPTVRLALSPYRVEARRALSGVKSTSYGDYLFAWREAMARGFDEAVLLNSEGAICEGARSSVFWVREGELRTSELASGALPGIARQFVIEWARDDAIRVREGLFSPRELDEADEIFTTSAAQGPRAVALWRHDACSRTLQAPGPITAHFVRRWNQAVRASSVL